MTNPEPFKELLCECADNLGNAQQSMLALKEDRIKLDDLQRIEYLIEKAHGKILSAQTWMRNNCAKEC